MIDKVDTMLLRNAKILALRDEYVVASEQVKVMAAALLQDTNTNEESLEYINSTRHYDNCVEYMETCQWRYEQALHAV
jgi:hypothetical protein